MGLVGGWQRDLNGMVWQLGGFGLWLGDRKEKTIWNIENEEPWSLNIAKANEKSTKIEFITKA